MSVIAEVIAIRFPLSIEVAAPKAGEKLKNAGVKGITAKAIEKHAKEIGKLIDARRANVQISKLLDAWAEIPNGLGAEYTSPPGWKLTPTGASKSVGDKVVFDVPPMFISELLINEETQCQSVRLY